MVVTITKEKELRELVNRFKDKVNFYKNTFMRMCNVILDDNAAINMAFNAMKKEIDMVMPKDRLDELSPLICKIESEQRLGVDNV